MGKATSNAQSRTAEKLDMKFGQWIFCPKRKHDFSEICVESASVVWWLTHSFLRIFHEYSLDLCQTETGVNLIELRIFSEKKVEKHSTYHLTMAKIRLTILPWYTQIVGLNKNH